MSFMIVNGSPAHGLHFLVGRAAEINLSSRSVGKLRHPQHKDLLRSESRLSGRAPKEEETPMARPPSGKTPSMCGVVGFLQVKGCPGCGSLPFFQARFLLLLP